MKKVTYQQVADALNISRVTVWKAVNDKPGIAPDTKRSILQKAVEMGYPISIADSKNINVVTAPPKASSPSIKNCNVAVVVSRPETSKMCIRDRDRQSRFQLCLTRLPLRYGILI